MALVLTAVLLVGCIPSAFAADYTGVDEYKTILAQETYSEASLSANWQTKNSALGVYDGEAVLAFSTTASNNFIRRKHDNGTIVSKGIITYSFDMIVPDSTKITKSMHLGVRQNGGSYANIPLFYMTGGGEIRSGLDGDWTGKAKVDLSKWCSFVIQYDAEAHKFKLYAGAKNGTISEIEGLCGDWYAAKSTALDGGVTSFYIGTDNDCAVNANAAYIDNLTIKRYPKAYERINAATSAAAIGEIISAYDKAEMLDIPSGYYESGNKDYINSLLLTETLTSDERIATIISDNLGEVEIPEKIEYEAVDFDDNEINSGKFVRNVVKSDSLSQSIKYGLGGKAADDGAYVIEMKAYTGYVNGQTPRMPYMQYSNVPEGDITLEYSCLSENASPSLIVYMDDNSKIENLVKSNKNSMLTTMGSKTTGCLDGCWYKYCVQYDKESGIFSVYMNGTRMAEVSGTAGLNVKTIRLWNTFDEGTEKRPVSGRVAYDNIRLYSGKYDSAADCTDMQTTLESSETAKRIYIDKTVSKEDFFRTLTTDNSLAVYKDSSCKEPCGNNIGHKNVLVLSSESGESFDYYTIFDKNGRLYTSEKPIVKIDGVEAATLTEGEVSATYENAADGERLLLALYDTDGSLVKVALAADTVCSLGEITPHKGMYVKAMLWDGDMHPVTESVVLKTNDKDIDTAYYPGFVRKAVTLSYDDGLTAKDKPLIELLNKYGVGATFNAVSSFITDAAAAKELYEGHEVANHVKGHPNMGAKNADGTYKISTTEAIKYISEGRSELETIFGKAVTGYAWPYSDPGREDIMQYLKDSGVSYARPVSTTNAFLLPTDWMNWKPTCHHDYLTRLKSEFFGLADDGEMKLFYVWGHAAEFKDDDNFYIMEDFLQELKERGNIWTATNIEVYNYINAVDKLIITEDAVENPSETETVYVEVKCKRIALEPGMKYEF